MVKKSEKIFLLVLGIVIAIVCATIVLGIGEIIKTAPGHKVVII